MPDLDTDDLTALVKACDTDLGDPNLWTTPDGYPDSLALCIIDSIYSTGARYSSVVNVVGRYREYRTNQGGDPDTDGTDELPATITELGGPDPWATRIGNRPSDLDRGRRPTEGRDHRHPHRGPPGPGGPHHRRPQCCRGHRGRPQGR